MHDVKNSIALVDDRPFFEKAVRFGVDRGILSKECLLKIEADAPKGIVQIADHFGTAYLRTELETAVLRMVNLISLYLEDFSNGDLQTAAHSLRDNTLLSHSRGGSEMLKRLHAMPRDTGLYPRRADPSAQKLFINERTFAFPMSLSSYREEVKQSLANQMQIDFARWLARELKVSQDEFEDFSAEEIIRSAMLVLFVAPKVLEMPTKSQFVKLIETLRKKTFKPTGVALENFLREAPEDFARLARQSMQTFINDFLPDLKSSKKSPDELLHAETQGSFFVRETQDEDIVAYDKLVAKEWVRITKGNADDPSVLATIFLNVATGHTPKSTALLKEAKSIITVFRKQGFDSKAVAAFIDQHAPFEQRDDLKAMWLEDLLPDAEIHLADIDPQMPDTFMDRALKYFKENCVASWKGENR